MTPEKLEKHNKLWTEQQQKKENKFRLHKK
jgi:hypothetical protein